LSFKRIELYGFKSFADKTKIEFENGITAIVGPNGCGKSNVADAIRWVLGEQRTKLLRGSSMQDVIFSGTTERKSLSYTEVSLVFDNSDHIFDVEYEEVIISRKLYRSGESAYSINKNECRLKDITNILYNSGVGRDGYSIIGQGKVDEILNSKPEDRRAIFEDAAGISGFKARKKEAERKLGRTQENLVRIKDVLKEIERQLSPMKEQAETAKQYLILKEELKHLELNNYIYQYDSASDQKKDLGIKIEGLTEQIALREDDLKNANARFNQNFEDIKKIDKTTQNLNEELLNLTVSLEKRSGDTKVLREKISYLKEQAISLKQTLEAEKTELEETIDSIKAKEAKKVQNQELLAELRIEADEISNKYLEVVDELTESEGEVSDSQKQMLSAMGELSDVKSKLSSLQTSKNSLEERIIAVSEKIKEQDKKYFDYKTQKARQNSQVEQNKQDENELKLELDKLSKEHNEKVFALNEATDNLINVKNAINNLEHRKKVLEEMQKDFEGFNYSVKQVLKNSETNKELKNKIVGVVANLITVPTKYQTAVEMALGSAIQNVVTEDEQDAKYIVNYLKQNNLGRATFLPITAVKPRFIDNRLTNSFKKFGAFGVASDLIDYDKNLDGIFKNLLGATVIVDTLENAINLAKETRYAFRIVSLEGDIINPQGSITGGSKKSNVTNLIGREEQIKAFTEQLVKLEEKLSNLTTAKSVLAEDTTSLTTKIKDVSEKLQNIRVHLATLTEGLDKLTFATSSILEETENLRAEKASMEQKVSQIEDEIFNINSLQSNINSSKSSAEGSIAKRQGQFENLKKQRDLFNENMTNVKVKIAELNSELFSLDETTIELSENQTVLEAAIEELTEKIEVNASQIEKAESLVNVQESDDATSEARAKLNGVREKLNNLDEHKNSLQDNQQELEEDRSKLQNELTSLQNKKYREEMNLAKIDTDIENMQERIWEEYELTYSSALAYKAEEYDLKQGLINYNKTRREIDKLGYVNVNAIEDCKVLDERFTDLSTQAEDLTKAKDDLSKIIKELSEEMLTRFNNEFTKIQINFSKVFKELFGGGNAELVLTDPDETGDLLTQGIDIIAEPPGKKLQNITLLSGGERALTAIAILFAILKLRPMPFCLLDEIEAALDDANVGRFAKYLHKFSNETQFIVITHRKPTMELADALYGVTMQEKGVSKIVSVKLSEAVSVIGKEGEN
jgi:chromosome segregation protein